MMLLSHWMKSQFPDTIVFPSIYQEPVDGWRGWMARISGQEPTKEGTISGNIVEQAAPHFAQWVAMKNALGIDQPSPLSDVIDHAKVKQVQSLRERFEKGGWLCVAPITSVERFGFYPILSIVGEKKYALDIPEHHTYVEFTANDHDEALARSAKWYDKVRDTEIVAHKKRVRKALKKGNAPRIYIDAATLQLKHDGLLLSEHGQLLAFQNGAHGLYLVDSAQRCYADSMAPSTAAKMAIFGAATDGLKLSLKVDELPIFVGFDGWAEQDGGYVWDGWRLVKNPSKPVWKLVPDGEKARVVMQIRKKVNVILPNGKTLASSSIPSMFQGQTGPILAWGAWRAMKLLRRRSDK